MKVRDSGMPVEEVWERFFDPHRTLDTLEFPSGAADVVDFGCGYGTFTVAAAQRTSGAVYAIDIEPEMVRATAGKARSLGLTNVRAVQRDFVAAGIGLPGRSVDYAMLFNILHAEAPLELLREAFRILRPGGRVAIMHWIYDAATPRGPDLSIRPRPEECQTWLQLTGFEVLVPYVALPPHHYGMVGSKPT